jgi:integrase
MASLRKHPKSPFWFACFSLPNGVRTTRSTKPTDRKEAQRIANKYEDASTHAPGGRFTESQARAVTADIYAISNSAQLPSSTIGDYLASWLKLKEIEAGENTQIRYGVSINQFIKHLGEKAKWNLPQIDQREIVSFRDSMSARVTPKVNAGLKILRSALKKAVLDGLVDRNEADRVTLVKSQKGAVREPFTRRQLQQILDPADNEWRGMIIVGLYTGMRLGDIATRCRGNVDLSKRKITLVSRKTGADETKPICAPLLKFLEGSLPEIPDSQKQPLFPAASECYEKNFFNGQLSKQFHAVLVKAGLFKKRSTKGTGKGNSVWHTTGALSFHCRRHTFVSWLKDAGASDAVARGLAGHDSEAVNRRYTHLDGATLLNAVEKLPNVLGN